MLLRMVTALMIVAGTAPAQEANIDNGRDTYLYFCAECHGKDAAGIGPIATCRFSVGPWTVKNRFRSSLRMGRC